MCQNDPEWLEYKIQHARTQARQLSIWKDAQKSIMYWWHKASLSCREHRLSCRAWVRAFNFSCFHVFWSSKKIYRFIRLFCQEFRMSQGVLDQPLIFKIVTISLQKHTWFQFSIFRLVIMHKKSWEFIASVSTSVSTYVLTLCQYICTDTVTCEPIQSKHVSSKFSSPGYSGLV